MKIFLLSLILLSGVVPIFYFLKMKKLALILPLIPLFIFRDNWKRIYSGPVNQGLNQALAKTGLYMFLYGLLFGFGFIL